jgi:hypothetical protein
MAQRRQAGFHDAPAYRAAQITGEVSPVTLCEPSTAPLDAGEALYVQKQPDTPFSNKPHKSLNVNSLKTLCHKNAMRLRRHLTDRGVNKNPFVSNVQPSLRLARWRESAPRLRVAKSRREMVFKPHFPRQIKPCRVKVSTLSPSANTAEMRGLFSTKL